MFASDIVRAIESAILPMLVAVRLAGSPGMMPADVLCGIAETEGISSAVAMTCQDRRRHPQQHRNPGSC
jgi:hypothetical protein